MPLDRITDDNYQQFKQAPTGVLIVTATWCHICEEYKPIVESVAQNSQGVTFGEAISDLGKLRQLKREYPLEAFPTTIVMKNGQILWTLEGFLDYNNLSTLVEEARIYGSTVYLPLGGDSSSHVAAQVKGLKAGEDGIIYELLLLKDSQLGRKGETVERPKSKVIFDEGLEDRV